jgi:nucleotide-binding universal stress UspA family protein
MYSKILVASDGSGPSMRAARIAGAIAKAFSAQVTVVTVSYIPKLYADDMSAAMREGYEDEWRRVMDDTVKAVKQEGVEVRPKLIRDQEPAPAIVKEMEDGKYDLLVLGRTGAGSSRPAMMGGISRKLVGNCSCSVLIVR